MLEYIRPGVLQNFNDFYKVKYHFIIIIDNKLLALCQFRKGVLVE